MSYTSGTFVVHIRPWSQTRINYPWMGNKHAWHCDYGCLSTGMYLKDPEAPPGYNGILIPFSDIDCYYQSPSQAYYAPPVAVDSTNQKPDWQVQAEAHGWTPPVANISSFDSNAGVVVLEDKDIVPVNPDGTITFTFDFSVFEVVKPKDDALAMSEVKSWDKTNGAKVKVTSFVKPHRD
jgi:hypothetical protein